MNKTHNLIAKLLTFWIPISYIRKNLRNNIIQFFERIEIKKIHKNYPKILKKIQLKIQQGEKINVGFYVINEASFPAEPLFKKMLEDDLFNPFIVVIPDVLRGKENMFYQMNKTYNTLSKKYNNVYKSYNENTKKFINYTRKSDLICNANPYDSMNYKFYKIQFVAKSCLPIYVNYFYFGRTNYELNVAKSLEFNLFWKVFIENDHIKEIFKREKIINNNIVVSGYIKMDEYYKYQNNNALSQRKKILITPHHTIENINTKLSISNFLQYSNFFLKLPYLYPQIDFIFRPHPLLFINLRQKEFWGKEKVIEYIKKLNKIPNLIYQEGGNYMKTFAESDGIINDCGSFLAEYFYTGKPQCYMLNKDIDLTFNFMPEGIEMLNKTYKAFSQNDITEFINNVIINDNDIMKKERINFAKEKIMINFPHASEHALNYIKKDIL